MSTVVMWIVVIVFLAVIGVYWDEEQKPRQKIRDLQLAKVDFLDTFADGFRILVRISFNHLQ